MKSTTAADLQLCLRGEDKEEVVDCTLSFNGSHIIVLALIVSCEGIKARLYCNSSTMTVDLPMTTGSRPLGATFLRTDSLVIVFLLESGEIVTLDLSMYFDGGKGFFHEKEACTQRTERKGYKNFLKKINKSNDLLEQEATRVQMSKKMFVTLSTCLVQAGEWDSRTGAIPHRIKLVHVLDQRVPMLLVSLLNGSIAHIDPSFGTRVTHPQLIIKVWAHRGDAKVETIRCNLSRLLSRPYLP